MGSGKKKAVVQHHGQIIKTPAVGGSPTYKLICMYLHNEANFISLGVQRLCIMGDPISPGFGGWEGTLSRPGTGLLRTLGESLSPFTHPFSFLSGASGPEPSEVRILSVGILTPRMGHPGW